MLEAAARAAAEESEDNLGDLAAVDLVEAHDGTPRVRDEPPRGCVVRIEAPRALDEA